MHPNPRRLLPVLLLVLLIGGGLWWWQGQQTAAAQIGGLSASGTVEATQIIVASEVAGRIAAVRAAEGQHVVAGDVLVELDDRLLRAQQAQAEAGARAAANAAEAARRNAAASAANLELLEAGASAEQLAVATSALERAELQVELARAAYDALPEGQRGTPQDISLQQQLDLALAARDNAQAQLELLEAGARPEQLAAARAQAESAQAQADAAQSQAEAAAAGLEVLEVQLGRLTLVAPTDGTILTRSAEPGELALPGGTLLVLADLSRLRMTVYIPEDRYGSIALQQPAQVTVDSFPGESFSGTVVSIADQAEFTPRNVQTASGRKTTVFAVQLAISNPDGRLKPGMPADVRFGP